METTDNNGQVPPQRPLVHICRNGSLYAQMNENKSFLDELKKIVHSLAPRVCREDSAHFGCFATWRNSTKGRGTEEQFEAWGHDGDVVNAYMLLEILTLCQRHKQDFRCAVEKASEIKGTANKGILYDDRITEEKRSGYRREATAWKKLKDEKFSVWYKVVSSEGGQRRIRETMGFLQSIRSFQKKRKIVSSAKPTEETRQQIAMDWKTILQTLEKDESFTRLGPWHRGERIKIFAREHGLKPPSKEWNDPSEVRDLVSLIMSVPGNGGQFWSTVFAAWKDLKDDDTLFHPNQLRDKYKMIHQAVRNGKHAFKNGLELSEEEISWIRLHSENFTRSALLAENTNPNTGDKAAVSTQNVPKVQKRTVPTSKPLNNDIEQHQQLQMEETNSDNTRAKRISKRPRYLSEYR